jgi:hypothetical protein
MHCVRRKEGSKRVMLLASPTPSDMAEQPPAADALQLTLRFSFQARLRRGVRLRPEKKDKESRTTAALALESRWKRHGIMNA